MNADPARAVCAALCVIPASSSVASDELIEAVSGGGSDCDIVIFPKVGRANLEGFEADEFGRVSTLLELSRSLILLRRGIGA